INASRGVPFTGAVATFTDIAPSGGAGATATIIWGDGHTSSGTITQAGGVFTVSGTNTYASENTFTVSVTINDVSGANVTVNSPATVSNPIHATPVPVSTTAGQLFTGAVATFTDDAPSHGAGATATITWGDGHVTSGTLTWSAGVYTITGSNTYSSS